MKVVKSIAALALIAAAVMLAPDASADPMECQVTGILIIVALTGPVTVCSVNVNPTHTTQIDPSLQVDPHLLSRAPGE